MVEIPLEYVNFAETGSGTKEDPWSLDVKDKPKPGDYVNYTPKTATYVAEKRYTGINEDKSYTTDTSTKWRIFKIDKDYITLIPTNVVNNGFTLKGADGYNNAVYLLNDACNKLYSNSDFGATARSINELDVYNVSNYDKTTFSNQLYGKYGDEAEPVTPTHTYYPNIFAQEISSNIDGQGFGKGLLNQSDQTNLVTGSTKATSLKWHSNYYQSTASVSSTYRSLIFYKENTTSTALPNYFFASRCVLLSSNVPHFDVGYIRTNGVSWQTLYASDNVPSEQKFAIRPLVEIPLSKAKLAKPWNGDVSSGYVLMVK